MSAFSIISVSNGSPLYTGRPSYTGTYMKPGMLEFREVASPTPIPWAVGDYVDYSRTGHRYRLYSTPQVKKQARSTKYGGAFVYQNVQLFDDSKQLEICPFRDLVKGDNRIHFSTQPSISTFEGVDGIARRIQACLDDMYPNTWIVRLATAGMGASSELLSLMAEAREFTVSGVSLLGALDKVYEVWPEVGWTYSYDSTSGKNVLTIGGGGLASTDAYIYGKGNGLKTITRTVANIDELATRVFAYGSSRNMLPRWYNSQNIKDAESVDIQNLMLPVGAVSGMGYAGWGKTGNLPDAAKAFLDAPSGVMNRLGLRPKTYYFDGTGDLPEIYPTIREMTIKDVRDSKSSSSDPYYPKTTVYSDPTARVDTILSAQSTYDSGLSSDTSGKSNLISDSLPISDAGSFTQTAGAKYQLIYDGQFRWSPGISGNYAISSVLNLEGSVVLEGIESVEVSVDIRHPSASGTYIFSRTYELQKDGANRVSLTGIEMDADRVRLEDVSYVVFVQISVKNDAQETDETGAYSISGGIAFAVKNYRAKTFKASIRQIGFDINEQAALGDGKTIAMRSGKCAGRSFVIKSCTYVSASDSWDLEIIRSEDSSLSQWFPNADYPIEAGDEFVLLDIAMPDEYILVAEKKLLAAAQELLADVSVERWQYVPEIDAEFMVENNRIILPAQNMVLTDENVVDGTTEAILIDTVTINEGEAAIPTYKVTLRDRKKKTFTDAKGAEAMSSNPVTNATQESIKSISASGVGESYFTLDEGGNVTLKEQYANLWVPGWMAAGGIGTSGSGGGGLISTVYTWTELQAMSSAPTDDTSSAANANSIYQILQRVKALENHSGMTFVTAVTTWQDNTVDFTFNNGDVTKVDLNHEHSNYVPKTTQINGHSLSQDITLSATELGVASWAMDSESSGTTVPFERLPGLYAAGTQVTDTATQRTLLGVSAISYDLSSTGSETSLIKWEAGIGAWHVLGNLYADGWIAAGGIGSSSTGVTSLYDLTEVLDSTTPSANQVFYYNGSKWTSISLKTINNESLLGSGDIPISGGGSTVSWGTESGNTVVLNVEGTTKTLLLSTALGGYALESWVQSQGYLTTETDPTVPSWAKQSSLQFSALPALYTAGTAVTNSPSQTTLLGVSAISNNLSSTGSEASLIKWENNAWHFYGNLYADGWISAGGIGTGGGSVSILDDIGDVSVSSATSGQLLKYNGSEWVNTSIKTINGSSLLGSGDITISGGGSTVGVTNRGATTSGRIATISVDGTDTDIYNGVKWGTYDSTNYTIPVTINGTTRTLCVSGYSTGGGGGVTTETDPVFSASAAAGITTSDINNWNITLTASTGISITNSGSPVTSRSISISDTYRTRINDAYTGMQSLESDLGDLSTRVGDVEDSLSNFVTKTGADTISGAKTFTTSNVTLSSVSLLPASNNSAGIGSSSKRFANIYGVNGNLTGNLTFGSSAVLSYNSSNYALELSGVDSSNSSKYVGFSVSGDSFIDIGDARLVYDSGAQALHVTYKSGTGRTIGLFADGFVSAGGTAASSSVRFVTTDGGNQSISGNKVFTDHTAFTSSVLLSAEDITSGDTLSVYGSSRFYGNVTISGTLNGYVKFVDCTLAYYNNLTTKDNSTLYRVADGTYVYLGSTRIYSEA